MEEAVVGERGEGTGRVKRGRLIASASQFGIQLHLLAISILKMEQYAGSSFFNDIITMVRDPQFDITLFNTKIKDVAGCMHINERVDGTSISK